MTTGSANKLYDSESEFQRDAIKYIESRNGYIVKVTVSSYNKKGTPDLIICFKGRFVAIELKVKDNKPSKIQETKMKQIVRAGGIAKPAWTIQEIKEILDEIS